MSSVRPRARDRASFRHPAGPILNCWLSLRLLTTSIYLVSFLFFFPYVYSGYYCNLTFKNLQKKRRPLILLRFRMSRKLVCFDIWAGCLYMKMWRMIFSIESKLNRSSIDGRKLMEASGKSQPASIVEYKRLKIWPVQWIGTTQSQRADALFRWQKRQSTTTKEKRKRAGRCFRCVLEAGGSQAGSWPFSLAYNTALVVYQFQENLKNHGFLFFYFIDLIFFLT